MYLQWTRSLSLQLLSALASHGRWMQSNSGREGALRPSMSADAMHGVRACCTLPVACLVAGCIRPTLGALLRRRGIALHCTAR